MKIEITTEETVNGQTTGTWLVKVSPQRFWGGKFEADNFGEYIKYHDITLLEGLTDSTPISDTLLSEVIAAHLNAERQARRDAEIAAMYASGRNMGD